MRKLTLWIWVGFFLRLTNAFYNGFFGPSFDAAGDAQWFHTLAVEHSKNMGVDVFIIGKLYSYILGEFYFLTTDSLFLGSVLSVIGWLISAIILVRIMRILSFDMISQRTVMVIYAFLPSSLIYTSVTLREPFQLLFVNLAIYSALKIYLHKSVKHWFILGFSVFCMGALHGALLASGIFIVAGTLFLLTSRNRKGVSFFKVMLVIPIATLCLYYGFLFIANFSYSMEAGLVQAVQNYQEAAASYGGRAIYKTESDINGLSGLMLSMPIFLFQYLFEPMPWRMSSLVDIVALLENILRFWLIWNSLKFLLGAYRKKPKFVASKIFWHRNLIFFIFISFIVMESIWSLGTTNWGTGIRHHLPSIGLILLASFAYKNVKSLRHKSSNNS